MRLIDLTMPLWKGMPVCSTFPMNTSFRIEDSLCYETHGYRMYAITVDTEGGTCFMQPSQSARHRSGRMLPDIPLEEIILRETIVLTIPKKQREVIEADDIEAAFRASQMRDGDAVLVRTGWGDDERYFDKSLDYVLDTPHYSKAGATRLAEHMVRRKSNLFLSDTALLGYPEKHFIPEWCSRRPRPPNYPSPEAKEYLKTYTKERMKEDWEAFEAFPPNNITACKCLANCAKIGKERIKLIVLPLKILGAPSSTCRIVAVEE